VTLGRSDRAIRYCISERRFTMATDTNGREGSSSGAMAKELDVSPAKVKRALVDLGIEADFVKAGCAYYYPERAEAVRKHLAKT